MKEKIKLIYRILFIIISATGIFIHLDINDRDLNAHELSFFTLWSNIFCLVFMFILLIKHFIGKNTLSKCLVYFKGMALSSIICTFLIYHCSEYKIIMSYDTMTSIGIPIESIMAHYVVPFLFILDWLIFQPKGLFKWSHVFSWLAFPFIYIICFFTRCHCNSPSEFINVPKYPYFFLDYECIGFRMCGLYILILLIIFIAINTLIVFTDNYLYKSKQRR